MFKYLRYGVSILSLLFVTGVANANDLVCTTDATVAACPVVFTAIPTITPLCIAQVGTFLYTIKNNAPVGITLESISINIHDSLPAATTSIVAAPVPACVAGQVLGAGKSCNVVVSIQPTVVGILNRQLEIVVEGGQAPLVSPIQFTVCGTPPVPPVDITYGPELTTPRGCEILAAPTVTNTGPTAVNGDVCTSTGVLPASITGFTFSTPPGPGIITNPSSGTGGFGSGAIPTTRAQTSFNTIDTYIGTTVIPAGCVNLTGMNLGGLTLTPGCYTFSSSALLSGILTLNGAGFYYFITGSTLTTATGSSVILEGGATAGHVFWAIGTSATLGVGTIFNGNILANVAISMDTGASINGVAWTNGPIAAAVTLQGNTATPGT